MSPFQDKIVGLAKKSIKSYQERKQSKKFDKYMDDLKTLQYKYGMDDTTLKEKRKQSRAYFDQADMTDEQHARLEQFCNQLREENAARRQHVEEVPPWAKDEENVGDMKEKS